MADLFPDFDLTIPSGPYFFKKSRRFDGQALESFIFKDSIQFFILEARKHRDKDALSEHIDFLIKASKHLEAVHNCPICGFAKIKYLFFLNHRVFDLRYSCCDSASCQQALKANHDGSFVALNLNGLKAFRKDHYREQCEAVFRKAFGVNKNISPEKVFEMFKSAYVSYVETEEARREYYEEIKPREEKEAAERQARSKIKNRYSRRRPADAIQQRLF